MITFFFILNFGIAFYLGTKCRIVFIGEKTDPLLNTAQVRHKAFGRKEKRSPKINDEKKAVTAEKRLNE